MSLRLLALIPALLLCIALGAQPAAGSVGPADAVRDTAISFVTVYPGAEVYELEGHSALRVRIGEDDLAVNFGLFDFKTPNFVYRFVRGETDYMVGAYPWEWFVASYAGEGRRIVEQPLALDSAAGSRLLELLNEQLQPPHNVYRYNYVLDNCATRPLGLVMLAAGLDSLDLAEPQAERAGARTFRRAMRFYHRNYPWYQLGIDLALGSEIDQPISRLEQTFAPIALEEAITGSVLAGEAAVVIPGPEEGAVLGPTPWWLSPVFAAWLLLAVSILVTAFDFRSGRMSRGFDAALFGLLGTAGCIITFLIFFSEHYATSPNILIWWLNPLCFVPTVFIWTRRGRRIVKLYQICNFAVLAGFVLAWPFCRQSGNPAFWPVLGAEMVRSLHFIIASRKDTAKRKK